MSENASGGNGNSANGATGGAQNTSNGVNETALNDLVFKAVRKQFKKLDLSEAIKSAVAEALPTIVGKEPKTATEQPQQQTQQVTQGNNADGETKLTLKALQDQFEREKKARLDLENRLKEADIRTRAERMRSEVTQRASAKLGAENPMLAMFMESFHDTRKRVVEQDGNYFVKFKDSLGEEELRPLGDAFDSMFAKDGEFHHLVQTPSKAGALPPRTVQARGNPASNGQQRNANTGDAAAHPIYGTVIQHLRSNGDIDKAAGLEHVASVPLGSSDK